MKSRLVGAVCACTLAFNANAALTDFNIVPVHKVGITEFQCGGLTTIVVTANKQKNK